MDLAFKRALELGNVSCCGETRQRSFLNSPPFSAESEETQRGKPHENIQNGKTYCMCTKRRGTKRSTRGWHTDVLPIFKPLLTQSCFVFCGTSKTFFFFPFHFHQLSVLPKPSSSSADKIFPSCFQNTRNDWGQTQVLTVHRASQFELRSSSPNEETLTPKMKGVLGRLVFTPQFRNTAARYLR